MEIDDLITLKLFDKALKEINQLKGYDFHKYKAKFYMAQSYFEESVSLTIEMWKLADNPFHKLEYYLFRALINHKSHFKNRVQEFLQKFEADISSLYSSNYKHLLINYLELKVDLNKKDNIKRSYYIEELFKIAPRVVKFQHELLSLSDQDEEDIRENLYPLVKKYDSVIKDTSPLNRILKIRDLLGALFIKIGDLENSRIHLEGAMELIGDGMPDIRESLESKLTGLKIASNNNFSKKTEPQFQYIKADIVTLHTLYSKHGKEKLYYASYISDGDSYIVYCKGKASIFLKSDYNLTADGGRYCTYSSKADWMRDFYYSIKLAEDNPVQRSQHETLVQAKLIEGKITGIINIGKGELVTLRGPMGSGKSEISNYLLGVEHPEKGEIFIDGTLLGGLQGESLEKFRNDNMALVVEGRVILPKNIMKDHQKEIDIDNFIDDHPKEIISAVNDLKNLMTPINNFFYHCIAIFKLKPKLILMNEPFMNLRGQLLENWLKVLSMLAKHHEIAIVLETHHAISSFYADCQYFIRDHKIVEIIEKV